MRGAEMTSGEGGPSFRWEMSGRQCVYWGQRKMLGAAQNEVSEDA